MSTKPLARFSPAFIIVCSMLFTILAGTILLALPAARLTHISWIDLLFTATSATCVTGLFTAPLSSFTTFGQLIIMTLVQIGGLGLITLTIFLMSLFVDFGFATQLMAGQLMQLESWKKIKQLIIFIICLTVCVELLGAACIFLAINPYYPLRNALFLSVFHAISSFCNAGIGLMHSNMLIHAFDTTVLWTTMLLMLSGGLGFITWTEIFKYGLSLPKKKRHIISLHSKIILYATVIIIAISTAIIFALERNHAFAALPTSTALLHSLFHAISFRSGGLLTVPIVDLYSATLFFALIIAFIGASPGSTGSGIKLTSLALFFATIKTAISGRNTVEIKGRSIAQDQINKAMAIISLSLMWITLTTFLLLITEQGHTFFDLFFESISAFATLGLSTNITATLSSVGKIILICSMLIGRIGSLTLILALRELRNRTNADVKDFSYPEERVILT